MFTNPRIEIFLDRQEIGNQLIYVKEYYLKVKETAPPQFCMKFVNVEFHIRKFPSKDSREQFYDMIKEAQSNKEWLKPLQTKAKIE